jgi:protein-S-isoprenylcysteine O-methyltransferase Ste14
MAQYEAETIPELIRSLLADTRSLIRDEVALARAEIREELSAAKTVAVAFGAATVAAVIGAVLFFVAAGSAIASLLAWPAWTGYAIVAVLLLGGAFALAQYGRSQVARIRGLPKTTETVKENLAWMQSKSVPR